MASRATVTGRPARLGRWASRHGWRRTRCDEWLAKAHVLLTVPHAQLDLRRQSETEDWIARN